ncbi:MAG: L-histidine N(alpha)-methyltransferase, partial [Pseudomonadota bacterium]
VFNKEASRIEMHLVSQADQTIHISDQEFHFAEGETLHTESSYKYTIDGVKTLAHQSGWALHQTWTDPKDWFGIFLLKGA